MVYPNHQLLQISGVFGTGASPYEIWSTSIRTVAGLNGGAGGTSGEVLTEQELADYLEVVGPELVTALNSSALNVGGSTVKINLIKYNQIDGDGHYLYDTTNQLEVANSAFGGALNMRYPTQVAKVLTLETGFTRGVASRGRMFIPGPANAFTSTTGTLDVAAAELTAWAAVVKLLSRELPRGGDELVIRPAVVSGIGTGFGFREITGVSMDNRPDVQRRRANDIVGTRLEAPLP